MPGLACFTGNKKMSDKVEAYMKTMPEFEAAATVLEEEHKILHDDVNKFKKKIGKEQAPYNSPDIKAEIEKIKNKYNTKIAGLKATYEFIPSETQYAALKRLTAGTADLSDKERAEEFKRRAELHNKSYQESIKGTLTPENENTERVADFAAMTEKSMQRFFDNPKPFEGKGETFENGSRIDEDGNVMSENDFVTLKEKVLELKSKNISPNKLNAAPKAYLDKANKQAAKNAAKQIPLFSQSDKPQTPLNKAKVQKIIDFFEKGLNLKVFAPLNSFADKLRELGYGSLQAMVGYYENANIDPIDGKYLAKAKKLKEQGVSNSEIRVDTGWFIGLDGGWKFDIDDSNANFTKTGKELKRLSTGDTPIRSKSVPLANVFRHDDFFEKYPELKNRINIVFYEDNTANKKDGGGYSEYSTATKKYTIGINLNYDGKNADRTQARDLREIVLHEIQHTIQGFRGGIDGKSEEYAGGTSKNYIKSLIDKGTLKIFFPMIRTQVFLR